MTTFVESYSGETSEDDEVVIVPYEKPVPPLITLAESESDNDSECSIKDSPPSSPRPKKRRIDAIVVGDGFGADRSEVGVATGAERSDVSSNSNALTSTSKTKPISVPKEGIETPKSSKRKEKPVKKNHTPMEDGNWDLVSGSKTSTPSTSTSSSAKILEPPGTAAPSSAASTPCKSSGDSSFTEESKEEFIEFIRFAASLGLPVMTPESQEALLRNGRPDSSALVDIGHVGAVPVSWTDVDVDEEEEDDDGCIIIEDDDDEEEEVFRTEPSSQPQLLLDPDPDEEVEVDSEPEPTTKIELDAKSECEGLLTRNQHNQHIFPLKWTAEMQHFYGDERPNFNMTKISRNQSSDDRLWEICEDLCHRSSKKRSYIQCNNCQQRGHRMRECPEKIKGLICWMCGEHGDHHVERCPKRMCLNCGTHTKRFQYPCNQCDPPSKRLRGSILVSRCAICDTEGHLDGRCPDHWRRFHSTKVTMIQVQDQAGNSGLNATPMWKVQDNGKSEYRRKSQSSCANCGMKGHNYFQCKGSRPSTSCFTNTPFIIHELSKLELGEIEAQKVRNKDHTNEEAGDEGTKDKPDAECGVPNFDPKTERVVSLKPTDLEMLRDAYEQKVPAALLFFSKHIQTIVKIIPRPHTIDLHLNGSESKHVRHAKRNLYRLLTKLKLAKGILDLEESASTEILLPSTSDGFGFVLDKTGSTDIDIDTKAKGNWPIADSRSGVKTNNDLNERDNNNYMCALISRMVPNPYYQSTKQQSQSPIHLNEKTDISIGVKKPESDADTTDDEFQKDDNKPKPRRGRIWRGRLGRAEQHEYKGSDRDRRGRDEGNNDNNHSLGLGPEHDPRGNCRYWYSRHSESLTPNLTFAERKARNRARREGRGEEQNPEQAREYYLYRRNGKFDNDKNPGAGGSRSKPRSDSGAGAGSGPQDKPRARAPRYFD